MADPATLLAIEAAVETIFPSVDGRPGAAELGVQRHVAHSMELFLPGFADLLATLLDAYASDVHPGASFTELDLGERGEVLRLMCSEESDDLRDVVDALFVFVYGGMYSEWTGYDRESRTLTPPLVWQDLGFRGPSRGHPDYRSGGR